MADVSLPALLSPSEVSRWTWLSPDWHLDAAFSMLDSPPTSRFVAAALTRSESQGPEPPAVPTPCGAYALRTRFRPEPLSAAAPSPNVPDSALAVLGDRRPTSARRVVPVRFHGVLLRRAVALGDRRGDRLVLLDRRRQLVEQHVDVEPRIALALRLDRAVQRDDARTGDALDVRRVELQVEIEQPRRRRLGLATRRRAPCSRRAGALTSCCAGSAGSDAASLAANPSRWPTMRNTSRPSPRVSGRDDQPLVAARARPTPRSLPAEAGAARCEPASGSSPFAPRPRARRPARRAAVVRK